MPAGMEIYPENDPIWADMTEVQRELIRTVIDACSEAQFEALLTGEDVVAQSPQIGERVVPKLSPEAVTWAATLWCGFIAQKHLQDMRDIGPPPEAA
jgi:hypothetical protein